MWTCKHCNNIFNYLRTTEKANHSRHCSSNPNKNNSYINIKKSLNKTFNNLLGEYKLFVVVCDICEINFNVTEREKQHPLKKQYFCSKKCSNSVGGRAKSAKYHYDEVASYTTVAWRHHEKKCVVCDEQNIVAVHHLNENHEDNNPKNLIPLCPTHHHYMHSKHKVLIEDIVKEYLKNKWGL